MSVEIKEVKSKNDYKAFVDLQFEIYKNNKFWVPPIKKDELKALKSASNPAFSFCEAKFWLAYIDNRCVGRIGAIINKKCNEKNEATNGRFSRAEFIDDKAVSSKLFNTATTWLKNQGMNNVQGPLGFTNLDHQGMLVEGFDHLPSAVSEYHLPYYKDHLSALGFEKDRDWVEFRLFVDGIPDKVARISGMLKKTSRPNS
jgi:hypothetical protein